MSALLRSAALAATLALAAAAPLSAARAGDCEGTVVGVRSVSQYNHAAGNGFLAVRNGPGSGYRQVGELYRGDHVSAYDKSGKWYAVTCMWGRCTNPLWGPAYPQGWVHGGYLSLSGVCPR